MTVLEADIFLLFFFLKDYRITFHHLIIVVSLVFRRMLGFSKLSEGGHGYEDSYIQPLL